jgi:hypothetical protein
LESVWDFVWGRVEALFHSGAGKMRIRRIRGRCMTRPQSSTGILPVPERSDASGSGRECTGRMLLG